MEESLHVPTADPSACPCSCSTHDDGAFLPAFASVGREPVLFSRAQINEEIKAPCFSHLILLASADWEETHVKHVCYEADNEAVSHCPNGVFCSSKAEQR